MGYGVVKVRKLRKGKGKMALVVRLPAPLMKVAKSCEVVWEIIHQGNDVILHTSALNWLASEVRGPDPETRHSETGHSKAILHVKHAQKRWGNVVRLSIHMMLLIQQRLAEQQLRAHVLQIAFITRCVQKRRVT